MRIIERLETNIRKAIVECPQCLTRKEMDYYRAVKRPLDTDTCTRCTTTAMNKTNKMKTIHHERIDKFVEERNKETNNLYIIKFTDKRERCLIKCNVCNKEYESQYGKHIFTAKGCKICTNKLPKFSKERSEYYNPRLHEIYKTMVQRTTNANRPNASEYYIDKGITVCKEWLEDRETFFKWAQENGYNDTLSIDRKDGTKGYYPDNCRWATKAIQARNTKLLRKSNTSGFRGVSLTADKSQWRARITVNSVQILLGVFDTPLEAALAYDNYVLSNNLEHTRNFS